MKRIQTFLLLLVTTSTLVVAGPPQNRITGKKAVKAFVKDEKQAVEQAVERLRKAMIDPKQSELDAIAADELSYGHSSGMIEDKAAFAKALVSGDSDFKTITLTDQTVTIVGQTALVRHKLSAETNNKGVPGQAKLGILLVFVKQKGDWKLLARQAVKI